MSSDYRVICLSHDPAILEDGEERELEQAINGRHAKTHPHCDLAIGRYSYPLIEVTCLGRTGRCGHRKPDTIEAGWLRLLHKARHSGLEGVDDLTRIVAQCWPPERLERLATLLFEEEGE